MILHLIAIDFHDCCPSTVSASKISHVTINWCGPSINFKLHQLANGIWPMIIIQFEKFMFYCFQRLRFRLWNIPFPFTNYEISLWRVMLVHARVGIIPNPPFPCLVEKVQGAMEKFIFFGLVIVSFMHVSEKCLL